MLRDAKRSRDAARASVEKRRQNSERAALEAAVGTVISRAPELSQSQLNVLRLVLAPALNAGEQSDLPRAG